MKKQDLIKYIADNSPCSLKEAHVITHYVTGAISTAIAQGHEIDIEGLGKFSIKNFKNTNIPYFTPSKDLKLACN